MESWWDSIGAPRLVASPMVDQSELAFRLLCRRYGAELAYTPMIHATLFCRDPTYRRKHMPTPCAADRPLIAQFCGNEAGVLVEAARWLERGPTHAKGDGDDGTDDEGTDDGGTDDGTVNQHAPFVVDAVDLNLGCPENIAKKGGYGAFLLTDPDSVIGITRTMCQELTLPVTCKIRLFEQWHRDEKLRGLQGTLNFCRALEASGVQALCVHARTRHGKGPKIKRADWEAIRAIKHFTSLPIIANGNIASAADVTECFAATSCDAVMSAEGLLSDPSLFFPLAKGFRGLPPTGPATGPPSPLCLAAEYLDLCALHPPEDFLKCVKPHLFRMLYSLLPRLPACSVAGAAAGDAGGSGPDRLRAASSLSECRALVEWAVGEGEKGGEASSPRSASATPAANGQVGRTAGEKDAEGEIGAESRGGTDDPGRVPASLLSFSADGEEYRRRGSACGDANGPRSWYMRHRQAQGGTKRSNEEVREARAVRKRETREWLEAGTRIS